MKGKVGWLISIAAMLLFAGYDFASMMKGPISAEEMECCLEKGDQTDHALCPIHDKKSLQSLPPDHPDIFGMLQAAAPSLEDSLLTSGNQADCPYLTSSDFAHLREDVRMNQVIHGQENPSKMIQANKRRVP